MAAPLLVPEDETARKAEALKTLSLGLGIAAIAGMVLVVIIWRLQRDFPIMPTVPIDIAIVLTSALTYWLAKAGKIRFAGYFFVIGFLVETAFITVMFGGATGPIGILYVFPILAGGIVLGTSYGFLIASLAVVTFLVMIPVEQTGLLPQIIGPPEGGTVIPLFVAIWGIFFYLIAFLIWYAASRLHRALRTVRLYAADLQSANEKLQASEEELRASNEELGAANEELRATEEELRASNEELEAANVELRDAQEQLVRTAKLAAIGQLAGGVGHELRNPLGAIRNAVFYIKGKVAKDDMAQREPRVVQFLEIVDDEVNAANKIISDLLNFSRVNKPAVSPVAVSRIIDDAAAHLTVPENIKMVKILSDGLPMIEVDTEQMRQVLVNIMTNAVQAMPEGGKLTLRAEARDGFLEISTTDTGGGIPAEIIGKIFDPLFTTRAKGIGLGLAVCKSIVERHGGRIEAASETGKGTTFTIRLPLKAG